MGNKPGAVTRQPSQAEIAISSRLQNRQDDLARARKIKLLLYGTGESGKTTILRQMQLIHGEELLDERKRNAGLIRLNVIEGAAFGIKAAKEKFNIEFEGESAKAATLLTKLYDFYKDDANSRRTMLAPETIDAILLLFKDPKFKEVLQHRSQTQIHDGWEFYVDKLSSDPNWGRNDWTPSPEDLLLSRIRTTGKNGFSFQLEGINYQLIDVGGQQAERRKYFKLFNNIDAVLYVVSLSEYDQRLFEDESQNRLVEAIKLWRNTVNHDEFASTWFLFFFNKLDLFKQKYERVPIKLKIKYEVPPPRYEEDKDLSFAKNWYENLFMSQVKEAKKSQVRMYFTSALEPDSISKAMNYCTNLFLNQVEIGHYM